MNNEPMLLALFSDSPGQGKTTAAKLLNEEKGYASISFAAPIKQMTKNFLMSAGFEPSEADRYVSDDLKDEYIPGFEFTGRGMQIAIGEQMRELDPEIWVKHAVRRIQKRREKGTPVVVDDLRRRNEYAALAGQGAAFIHVHRNDDRVPGFDFRGTEGNLTLDDADVSIFNGGGIEALRETITDAESVLRELR